MGAGETRILASGPAASFPSPSQTAAGRDGFVVLKRVTPITLGVVPSSPSFPCSPRVIFNKNLLSLSVAQEAASGQTTVGQLRLSSETLGKLTSDSTLVTPEVKPTKPLRGSMVITKSKTESHGSGSQKQHHQHAPETPQVQIRAPPAEGWGPSPCPSSSASCSLGSTASWLGVPSPGSWCRRWQACSSGRGSARTFM